MDRPSVEASFPGRISRTLARASGLLVAIVLLVGGTSLVMASRIYLNNEAVAQEYVHILQLDQVHSLFDDLIFELHQIESTGHPEHAADVRPMQERIVRQLDALHEVHLGEHAPAEQAALGALRQLSAEGQAVTKRLSAGPGRAAASDVQWLNRATREVPFHTEELTGAHRSRITRLMESSQRLVQIIGVLYAAFLVLGGALVAVASRAASRGIAAPLRRLAEAAQGIAEGRLETRVPVRSSNEIGRLGHSFNVMADRLLQHERDLQSVHATLEAKLRESQTLYLLGTEIARALEVDQILQSVVDKARELLRCDAVALCLWAPGRERLVPRKTSGPLEAFRGEGEPVECEPVEAERVGARDAPPCPVIRPEYARAHLAAPVSLGDDVMGALYVARREEREFIAAEAEMLGALATASAVAIERARLSEEVRSLAAVEERERLAREMHDGLAQALGLLHLKLQGALARTADTPAVAEDLREMVHITEGAYEEVRQSIFGLRTFVSRGLSLVPTLTEYLHEFSVHNGLAVELEVPGGALGPVPPASEVQAVRIIQEALNNVRKHAAADHARVRLQRDGAWLRVTVEDDGAGWDRTAAREGLHFGLQTMRERAEGLGGRLEIETAPGRGTRVVATLPGGGV